ncbi:hypothetical protein [Methylocystis sp. B8]|uniref:hypothetical protein n=1 Tax=Methylocystis sp. B8 TaxID=544938 RepID=UPI0014855592|nr:hypothetical protein [Methylocystis sp. B8]
MRDASGNDEGAPSRNSDLARRIMFDWLLILLITQSRDLCQDGAAAKSKKALKSKAPS